MRYKTFKVESEDIFLHQMDLYSNLIKFVYIAQRYWFNFYSYRNLLNALTIVIVILVRSYLERKISAP